MDDMPEWMKPFMEGLLQYVENPVVSWRWRKDEEDGTWIIQAAPGLLDAGAIEPFHLNVVVSVTEIEDLFDSVIAIAKSQSTTFMGELGENTITVEVRFTPFEDGQVMAKINTQEFVPLVPREVN